MRFQSRSLGLALPLLLAGTLGCPPKPVAVDGGVLGPAPQTVSGSDKTVHEKLLQRAKEAMEKEPTAVMPKSYYARTLAMMGFSQEAEAQAKQLETMPGGAKEAADVRAVIKAVPPRTEMVAEAAKGAQDEALSRTLFLVAQHRWDEAGVAVEELRKVNPKSAVVTVVSEHLRRAQAAPTDQDRRKLDLEFMDKVDQAVRDDVGLQVAQGAANAAMAGSESLEGARKLQADLAATMKQRFDLCAPGAFYLMSLDEMQEAQQVWSQPDPASVVAAHERRVARFPDSPAAEQDLLLQLVELARMDTAERRAKNMREKFPKHVGIHLIDEGIHKIKAGATPEERGKSLDDLRNQIIVLTMEQMNCPAAPNPAAHTPAP